MTCNRDQLYFVHSNKLICTIRTKVKTPSCNVLSDYIIFRFFIVFIAEELGIKPTIPAYRDPNLRQEDLLTGVTFASGGAGYVPLTTQIAV